MNCLARRVVDCPAEDHAVRTVLEVYFGRCLARVVLHVGAGQWGWDGSDRHLVRFHKAHPHTWTTLTGFLADLQGSGADLFLRCASMRCFYPRTFVAYRSSSYAHSVAALRTAAAWVQKIVTLMYQYFCWDRRLYVRVLSFL